MSRGDIARNYFSKGYNCSQSVVLAFADLLNVPEDTLSKISLPFGGGLGRLRQTCGALSGVAMCLGLLFPDKTKGEIYALVQEAAKLFQEQNGSINCGELLSGVGIATDTSPKPEARTDGYYKKRPCAELVYSAAEILEEVYLKHSSV